MGGSLTLESEFGVGTTFCIDLPLKVTKLPEQPIKNHNQTDVNNIGDIDVSSFVTLDIPNTSNQTHSSSNINISNNNRILIIDDDIHVLEWMERYLVPEGFEIITTTNPEEGIQLAKEVSPNAIILDVMMPIMDGWSVLNQLKADPELAMIPVVMATLLEEQNLGYALGASDYLTKPIDSKRLKKVLSKYRSNIGDKYPLAMIVDDNPLNRDLLTNMLRKEKWQTLEAENGAIALKLLESYQPDLLLLDLIMPEVDGFEVARKLQQNSKWSQIPIIVVTAKDLALEDRQRLNGRVSAILQKGSYDRDHLLKQIRGLLTNLTQSN